MRYRSLTRETQPSVEPVSLAEAKLHLRIDNEDDDALIQSLRASINALPSLTAEQQAEIDATFESLTANTAVIQEALAHGVAPVEAAPETPPDEAAPDEAAPDEAAPLL